jgi:ABC-2 type transport system permease protein
MTAGRTLATAERVLRQVRRDPRTLALLIVVPCVLLGLLAWIYSPQDEAVQAGRGGLSYGGTPFDRVGAPLLGVFPFVVMFLVTSVATLRERQSGTLERLLTMPLGKADLIGGYALAFGILATVQALVASGVAVGLLGLDVAGPTWLLIVVAVVDAVLGTAVGLFVSAFARTEFQAVQFMPAIVLPQFLLCGLLVPRDQLPGALGPISDALPLSYAVDAMRTLTTERDATGEVLRDVGIVAAFALVAVGLAAATLRRRTP